MVQRGSDTRLALEALGELLFGNLDGDLTVQPRISRGVDLAHTAAAQCGKDLVRA
jgi:hypothetical protein